MIVQSKVDNGLPIHLWDVFAQSNSKTLIYHMSFAEIKNSEGNIFPLL